MFLFKKDNKKNNSRQQFSWGGSIVFKILEWEWTIKRKDSFKNRINRALVSKQWFTIIQDLVNQHSNIIFYEEKHDILEYYKHCLNRWCLIKHVTTLVPHSPSITNIVYDLNVNSHGGYGEPKQRIKNWYQREKRDRLYKKILKNLLYVTNIYLSNCTNDDGDVLSKDDINSNDNINSKDKKLCNWLEEFFGGIKYFKTIDEEYAKGVLIDLIISIYKRTGYPRPIKVAQKSEIFQFSCQSKCVKLNVPGPIKMTEWKATKVVFSGSLQDPTLFKKLFSNLPNCIQSLYLDFYNVYSLEIFSILNQYPQLKVLGLNDTQPYQTEMITQFLLSSPTIIIPKIPIFLSPYGNSPGITGEGNDFIEDNNINIDLLSKYLDCSRFEHLHICLLDPFINDTDVDRIQQLPLPLHLRSLTISKGQSYEQQLNPNNLLLFQHLIFGSFITKLEINLDGKIGYNPYLNLDSLYESILDKKSQIKYLKIIRSRYNMPLEFYEKIASLPLLPTSNLSTIMIKGDITPMNLYFTNVKTRIKNVFDLYFDPNQQFNIYQFNSSIRKFYLYKI